MNRTMNMLCIGLTLFMLGGCASAKLNLELAIYKEDPFPCEPVTRQDIDEMLATLKTIDNEADDVAKARSDLANDLFSIYEQIYYLNALTRNPEYTKKNLDRELCTLTKYLDEFNDKVTNISEHLIPGRKRLAEKLLKHYKNLLPQTRVDGDVTGGMTPTDRLGVADKCKIARARRAAWLALSDLGDALERLQGPLGTNFEKYFTPKKWQQVVVATAAYPDKLTQEYKKLHERIKDLAERTKKAEDDGLQLTKDFAEWVMTAAEREFEPGAKDEELKKIADIEGALKGFWSTSTEVSYSRQTQEDIRYQIKMSNLMSSQIERLQDPADPVWRIVSDPGNRDKWNVEFSRAYFYAEGDSSVVVVRDSPADFRIQQGKNNPAALVQAQLQISRAIGDAAIAVAGATTGVNVAALRGPKQRAPETADTGVSDSEAIAERRAVVQKEAELRALAITALTSDLRTIRMALYDLREKPDTEEAKKALLHLLETTLKAHVKRFAPFK